MKKHLSILVSLLVGTSAFATSQDSGTTPQAQKSPVKAKARPRPCKGMAPNRDVWPNGTMLWGTGRTVKSDETSTVLASVDLSRMQIGGTELQGVRLQGGRLMAPLNAPKGLAGAMLQGADSAGNPVEVAVCEARPAPEDPEMEWYRIEIWNPKTASWENPCKATLRVPKPRALAVSGVWDGKGAHQEMAGKFTFACENGAIAKCIDWGYKPWASKDGRALAPLHQACTRMARGDYCGDGRSHTRQDTVIDMYDGLGVLTRATQATAGWNPRLASFEAAWGTDGAWCLSRTRYGQPVEQILQQCPGRFEAAERDLGQGDRCTMVRKDAAADGALMRNHSYNQGR